MRAVSVCAVLALAACVDQAPTSNARFTPEFSLTQKSHPTVFNVQLRPENEPGPLSNSDANGYAQVKVYDDGTIEFLFVINNKSNETFTRAHIHKAPAGVNGPIHWNFLEPADPATSISDQPARLPGIAAAARADASVADLLANPSGYYVNVHSTANLSGAVRGQLQ